MWNLYRWGKLKRIYIGGVNLFYTRLTAEWLPRWGKPIVASVGVQSFSTERLPRWGQTVVASVGSGWFVYVVIASKRHIELIESIRHNEKIFICVKFCTPFLVCFYISKFRILRQNLS